MIVFAIIGGGLSILSLHENGRDYLSYKPKTQIRNTLIRDKLLF